MIELDGHADSVKDYMRRIELYCQQKNHHYQLFESPEEQEQQWEKRRSISEALRYISTRKKSHDISVPPSQIAYYMAFLDLLNQSSHLKILGYGHLGDGNIHVNLLQLPTLPVAEEEWNHIEDTLFKKALELVGSITGEHGIGVTKKEYMKLMFSATELNLFKQLKLIFDPQKRLNPYKIL
jgi:glycolate oxidase